jgi:hypothetical protein
MSSQQQYQTVFGSLKDYTKGDLEIINDNPKYYTFSNVFEVAAKSKPYEKVAVAKNLEYVIEAVRAEGTSSWYAAAHDEFAVVMDGSLEVELVELAKPEAAIAHDKKGSQKLAGEPAGKPMGRVKMGRGHQLLLPQGAAYRFKAAQPGVFIMQTIVGDQTVEKWSEICYT